MKTEQHRKQQTADRIIIISSLSRHLQVQALVPEIKGAPSPLAGAAELIQHLEDLA